MKAVRAGLATIGAAGIILLAGGCSERNSERHDDSDRLYQGTLELAREYADSISFATDSASLERAFERFNLLLDSLNFTVEPDTDLMLSEGENDTVTRTVLSLRDLYETRKKEIERGATDSLNDSIQ